MNDPIEAYISTFPEATQTLLRQLLQTISETAPQATKCINYGMPTFKHHGNLVHFAAYKNHIGFYPVPTGLQAFKDDISAYKHSKGSVQFPLDKPLPLDLVARIVRFRISENEQKAQKKMAKKSR